MGKYNGWENYPTWLMRIHIDNDEWLYHYVVDELYQVARHRIKDLGIVVTKRRLAACLGNILKEEMVELFIDENTLEGHLFTRDLIYWCMDIIDWTEIAESYIDDDWEEENQDEENEDVSV